VTDLDPHPRHLTPLIFFSSEAFASRGFSGPFYHSQALFKGVPLEDIYMAAGWSSPHTFVRFYNLDVNKAPGS